MRLTMLVLLAASLDAQTPRVENSKLESRALTESLGKAMARIPGAAWAGYEVPAHGRGGRCGCDKTLQLFYRLESGVPRRLEMSSPECIFDAGGLPLVWFTGVKPVDSVAYLETLALKGAVAAIAQHEAANAVPALIRLTKSNNSAEVRKQAVFWLGQSDDERAEAFIEAMLTR